MLTAVVLMCILFHEHGKLSHYCRAYICRLGAATEYSECEGGL